MNPLAILALISDLYAQLTAAQERIAELEGHIESSSRSQADSAANTPAANGPEVVPTDFAQERARSSG